MAKSIGIDLGTTNSVSAIKKVKTEILVNSEGDQITPSCVIMKQKQGIFKKNKDRFVVGKNALEWMKQDPENTIVAIKRLMGRNLHDKEVTEIINKKQLRYKIQPHKKGSENSLAVVIGKKQFTPEEISAAILEKIRLDAEQSLAEDVKYAVITVPAYFNDKQKHATRYAAALAGMKVQRLLPEPTAAAISYGVDNVKDDDAVTILVFDLGGGTFDLSVLTVSGGQFIEQGKGGDMWLGGEDIDYLITDYVLSVVAEENNILDIDAFIEKQDPSVKFKFLAELKSRAEKAKIELSSNSEAFVEIIGVLKDEDDDPVDVDVEITREKFDEIIAPVAESAINLVRKLLADMNFSSDLIDKVLLVGGSSQIPLIAEIIAKEFGAEKVLRHKSPILAIAEGAAILSHRLSDTYECPQCGISVSQVDIACAGCGFDLEKNIINDSVLDIVHASAHDYYIVLENEKKHLLVEKGTPLPVTVTESFNLVHKDQKLAHLKFLNIVNDVETPIGDLWLGIELDEQQLEKMELENDPLNIIITLDIDENNLIAVTAVIKEFPDIKLSKTVSRGKADEKLFLALEKVIDDINARKCDEYVVMDALNRSLSIIRDIHEVIDPKTGAINETKFEKASRNIEKSGKMAAEGVSTLGTANYAFMVLDLYGNIMPKNVKKDLQTRLKVLEDADENGTYEENIQANDDLHESLSRLGGINMLMDLDKAILYAQENEPMLLSKFLAAKEDFTQTLLDDQPEKATSLLEDIMPEVYRIVDMYDSAKIEIHKDITR